jgi:hypothetical protein
MKYRKKVLIDAFQLGDKNEPDWFGEAVLTGVVLVDEDDCRTYYIHTLEGTKTCSKGYWIARGVKGELWPIRKDIFEETYEPAE